MLSRKYVAECLGTAVLVFFAVGTATLSFGFGIAGGSKSAGVVATALSFGLVLLALVYTIGPVSGCHVNPAVTIGFVVAGRMKISEAVGYWVAQFVGGILGALALWGVVSGAKGYSLSNQGLGTDGYGAKSMVHLNAGGAFAAEVILTMVFVLVVLSATSYVSSASFAGLAIGLALTFVHLIGIPLTGTSVNPARALGPALLVGGTALNQVWLFIVAPLVGGILAAGIWRFLISPESAQPEAPGAVEPTDLPAASE